MNSKMCTQNGGVRIKIGDFSKLTSIPVKTIRYYSDIGLLKPEYIDNENKYRQYGVNQIVELNRMLALKEAGFSLNEIIQMNKNTISKSELTSLLESKLVIAKNEQLLATMKIANLEARLIHIKYEEEYKMTDVTVKKVEPILVASIRKKGLTPDEFGGFFGLISDDVKAHGIKEVGPWTVLRHSEDDWEACVLIEKEYKSKNPDIKIYHLPVVEKMACVVHKGPWGEAMKPTIDGFYEWLNLNGLKTDFPYREIFHYGERENLDWSTFITELQYPIKHCS